MQWKKGKAAKPLKNKALRLSSNYSNSIVPGGLLVKS